MHEVRCVGRTRGRSVRTALTTARLACCRILSSATSGTCCSTWWWQSRRRPTRLSFQCGAARCFFHTGHGMPDTTSRCATYTRSKCSSFCCRPPGWTPMPSSTPPTGCSEESASASRRSTWALSTSRPTAFSPTARCGGATRWQTPTCTVGRRQRSCRTTVCRCRAPVVAGPLCFSYCDARSGSSGMRRSWSRLRRGRGRRIIFALSTWRACRWWSNFGSLGPPP
mmetsp:Transcript_32022/g.96389  ORF Transcript_32022/g.96389 Transcript_32022/m.96389 type:complete len:225 (-) Transcript_32022:53-727(-)